MTQRGFDVQLKVLTGLYDQYWQVHRRAEAALRRVSRALQEDGCTTGDPMRDYCLLHYGFFCEGMINRYQTVNEVLRGHAGELVLTEWNESLTSNGGGFPRHLGFLRHFKMGVLKTDIIEFPHKLNCLLPTNGYVTHEDIAEDGKLRPWGIHEDLEFFVPARIYDHAVPLMAYRELLENWVNTTLLRPNWHMASVIAGDDNVRNWFARERCGVPGGLDTCRRLEDRLRSAPTSEEVSIAV